MTPQVAEAAGVTGMQESDKKMDSGDHEPGTSGIVSAVGAEPVPVSMPASGSPDGDSISEEPASTLLAGEEGGGGRVSGAE